MRTISDRRQPSHDRGLKGAGRGLAGDVLAPSWRVAPITTQQHAVEGLRAAIASGELRPGQRVAQEDLAAALGVSVAPVREALRVLEQEGQLTYVPRRGYFVSELRAADLEEIYSLRELLESRAARRSIASFDDDAIWRVESAAFDYERAAVAGEIATALRANRRFHMSILESPDNPHTMRVIRSLWDSTEAYRALYYNFPAERHESLEAHNQILAAVRARDAEALIERLASHRCRALEVLRKVLPA